MLCVKRPSAIAETFKKHENERCIAGCTRMFQPFSACPFRQKRSGGTDAASSRSTYVARLGKLKGHGDNSTAFQRNKGRNWRASPYCPMGLREVRRMTTTPGM